MAQLADQLSIDYFVKSFESKKLSPCWIFVGPIATSLEFVKRIASSILLSPHNHNPLKTEMIAHHIAKGTYGNFRYITVREGETELMNEDILPLRSFCRDSAPFPGARVAIINNLDVMNRFVVNGLLKTLEEPPNNMFIFLLSEKIGDVLPTIKSRCHVFRLPLVGMEYHADAKVQTLALQLVDNVLVGDFSNVLQLCERVVGPNKGRYDEIAKAVLSVVYDKVTKDFETHLADHWLLCADFWQESKIRHLDEQQAFFVFLTGLHNPDYLKSHL